MVLFTVHICIVAAVGFLLDLATLNLSKEPILVLFLSILPSFIIFKSTVSSILKRREVSIYYGIAAMVYLLIVCGLGLLGGAGLSSLGGQLGGAGSLLAALSFPGVITAIVWLIILLKKRATMSEIFTEKTRENKVSVVWIFGYCLFCFLLTNFAFEDDKIGFINRLMELLL